MKPPRHKGTEEGRKKDYYKPSHKYLDPDSGVPLGEVGAEQSRSDAVSASKIGRFVSPHPSPLPWGEGVTGSGLRENRRASYCVAAVNGSPSPRGEGWGEGKGIVRTGRVLFFQSRKHRRRLVIMRFTDRFSHFSYL